MEVFEIVKTSNDFTLIKSKKGIVNVWNFSDQKMPEHNIKEVHFDQLKQKLTYEKIGADNVNKAKKLYDAFFKNTFTIQKKDAQLLLVQMDDRAPDAYKYFLKDVAEIIHEDFSIIKNQMKQTKNLGDTLFYKWNDFVIKNEIGIYSIYSSIEKAKELFLIKDNPSNQILKYPETNHPGIDEFVDVSQSNQKIETAINFHLKNQYNQKINNISSDGVYGALNKALYENFKFKLDAEELSIVHRYVKQQLKNKEFSK